MSISVHSWLALFYPFIPMPENKSKSFVSAAKLISLMTLLSRILGLVRDSLLNRYFGPDIMHYFLIPFQIPNLSRRLFGEGALTAALIPVYTEELKADPIKAKLLARSVITLLVIFLSIITLIGLAVVAGCSFFGRNTFLSETQMQLSLTAIMLPYMILICSVALVGGLLQVHRHFLAPAAAPIFLNTTIITGVIFFCNKVDSVSKVYEPSWDQIYIVAWSILIAGIIQFAIQIPALKKHKISLMPRMVFNEEPIRKIFRIMAPMLIGLAALQINTLLDNLIAFYLSATPKNGDSFTLLGQTISYPVVQGSVDYLYCAQRCYQFPLGVFGIALATAIFPFLSSCVVNNDMKGFGRQLNHGIRLTLFIAIPATIGMAIVATPMVKAIFEGGKFTEADTAKTASTLIYYSVGITAYCLLQLVVRAFYSFKDSITPMKIAVRMIVLNFLLNIILIWPLATGGLGLSTAVSAMIQVIVLFCILIKRYQLDISGDYLSCIFKSCVATGFMAVAGMGLSSITSSLDKYSQISILTFGCAAVYYIIAKLLKAEELSLLTSRGK